MLLVCDKELLPDSQLYPQSAMTNIVLALQVHSTCI